MYNNKTAHPDNYDFVPFPSKVNNTYITDIKKRHGNNSGYAEIEITTVDNLYIGSGFSHYETGKGILSETQKIIPASSLKGAVRQIARAVSDGCIPQDKIEVPVFGSDGNRIKKPNHKKINFAVYNAKNERILKLYKGFNFDSLSSFLAKEQLKKCTIKFDENEKKLMTNICIVCDMFGAMSLGSKIRFTDFEKQNCLTEIVKAPQQFSPDTASEKYWKRENGKISYKGYKFYKTTCDKRPEGKQPITAIKKGTTFKGRVYFKDLFDDQLELLLYSLGVGKNISLKLGGYKADGFGTVKTSCTELIVNDEKRNAYELANKYAKDNADILEKIEDILCYRER